MGAVGGVSGIAGVGGIFGGFAPEDIPDLLMWLDASSLGLNNNDSVTTWDDLSLNGNDVVASAGDEPTFITNAQNGRPAVRFAVLDFLNNSDSLNLITASTIFAVVELDSGTTADAILGKDAGDLGFLAFTAPDTGWNISEVGVGFIASEQSDDPTNWQVVTFQWDGSLGASSTGEIWRNNVSIATGTYDVANLANSSVLRVGGTADGGSLFDGDMGEIIIYDRVLVPSERTQLYNYLRQKWGI